MTSLPNAKNRFQRNKNKPNSHWSRYVNLSGKLRKPVSDLELRKVLTGNVSKIFSFSYRAFLSQATKSTER